MIEIPKQDLPKYIGKEVIKREQGIDNIIEFEEMKGGWLTGYNKTNHSSIQILLNESKEENAPKYFLK